MRHESSDLGMIAPTIERERDARPVVIESLTNQTDYARLLMEMKGVLLVEIASARTRVVPR